MSKQSDAVSALQSKIQNYLRQTVGSFQVLQDGNSSLSYGSTRVIITAHDLGTSGKTLVNIFAFVTYGVRVTDELYRYLMDVNKDVIFAKFFVVEDQKLVVCQETLLGDRMDPEELAVSVAAVAQLANEYDDKIVQRFGGKTTEQFEREAQGLADEWPTIRRS